MNTLSSLQLKNKDGIPIQYIKINDNDMFLIADCNLKFTELQYEFLEYLNRFCIEDNLGNKFPIATARSIFNCFFVKQINKAPDSYGFGDAVCYINGTLPWWVNKEQSNKISYIILDSNRYNFTRFVGRLSYVLSLDELEKFSKVELKETALDYYPCSNIYSILSNSEWEKRLRFDLFKFGKPCYAFEVFSLDTLKVPMGVFIDRKYPIKLEKFKNSFKELEDKDIYVTLGCRDCIRHRETAGTFMKLSDFIRLNEDDLKIALTAISKCSPVEEYKKDKQGAGSTKSK